jgi:hypothetical protein
VSARQAPSRSRPSSKGHAPPSLEVVPPEPPASGVFLPLTAADFHFGWSLEWSPELGSAPLLTPLEESKRLG